MVPILYETTATTFTTNGLGRLDDLIDCTVTEERNGEFYLIATIPITSAMYSKIAMSRIIFATAHDGDSGQAFRISKISKPFDGKVEIEAQHISYQLSWIPLKPFTASSCAGTMASIVANSAETNPFTFWTDISSTTSYTFDTPASVRNKLGGTEGSILSVYGGEYEFDNYTVKLHSARGEDKGVTLRYGKNITDISQEENLENTYTGICPYWQSEDTVVTVSGYVVESEYAGNYPFNRTKIVDFSSDFDEQPTSAQLLAAAQSYITKNCVGVPNVSIDVSFVSLAQTEEYKDIANLERVQLCDTVTVIFDKLDIAVSAKVVKTEYDVLNERYNEITIGTISASLATTISDIDTSIEDTAKETKSAYQKAINNATEQITGAKGGVIQTHYDANNQPYEMTIADNAALASASKVWRWNIGGLGFSSTGYDGSYNTAITQDGQIVADFITTGTLDASQATITNINASNINTGALNASLITTGTLDASQVTVTNLNASNITTGTLNGSNVSVTNLNASNITTGTIKNTSNNNTYWNLSTGVFKTTSATIDQATITNATITNSSMTGTFYNQGSSNWVQIKDGVISGAENGYTETGRLSFNKPINDSSGTYHATMLKGGDLILQGHLWADPDGGGVYRAMDDSEIEIVNWIQWVTQRSSGVEWVKEGTTMGCGKAYFHCGLLCDWEQYDDVVVGE